MKRRQSWLAIILLCIAIPLGYKIISASIIKGEASIDRVIFSIDGCPYSIQETPKNSF